VVEAGGGRSLLPGRSVQEATLPTRVQAVRPEPIDQVSVFSGGVTHDAPVFDRTALLAGDRIAGPALIREANATTVVEPGWTAEITALDHMICAAPRPCPLASPRKRAAPIRCCWNCSTTCS
jgi:5-oxoprolinase (ATP-hydrolysing)